MQSPTDADLLRWRNDCCAFIEEVLYAKRPDTGKIAPMHLFPEQREFVQAATRRGRDGRFVHQTCVLSTCKREGKTEVCAAIALWRCVALSSGGGEGQRVVILSNSREQSKDNAFLAMKLFVKRSPLLTATVEQRDNLVFANGSSVWCAPQNAATVQGRGVDCLVSDELHACENVAAWTFLSQQLEATDAQALVSSQAGAPVDANPLWRLWNEGRPAPHVLFRYFQEPFTPWAKAQAARARDTLLPGEYDYLWRNQWGATGLTLFAAGDIERALAYQYTEPRTHDEYRRLLEAWGWDLPRVVITCGLDRAGVGKSGDRSVWTTVAGMHAEAAPSEHAVLRCAVLPTGAECEVLAEYDATCTVTATQPRTVAMEAYGCADIVGRVRRATLESPTAQRQQQIFGRLSRAFTDGRMRLPRAAGEWRDARGRRHSDILKAELLAFSYDAERQSGSTLTRFGTQRSHDDCCYSLAWGTDAQPDRQTSTGFIATGGSGDDIDEREARRRAAEGNPYTRIRAMYGGR
jgi:hypothetical protein